MRAVTPIYEASARELLTVDDVTLQYKTPQHLVTATYRVGFSVQQGERYVILGPSGCGKSTLLKAVGGFMAPVTGGNISPDKGRLDFDAAAGKSLLHSFWVTVMFTVLSVGFHSFPTA